MIGIKYYDVTTGIKTHEVSLIPVVTCFFLNTSRDFRVFYASRDFIVFYTSLDFIVF
jgi:hypothetical protein